MKSDDKQSPIAVRDLARVMAVPQMLRLVLTLLEENEPFEAAELRLCHELTTAVATWLGAKVTALATVETCPSCGSSDQSARGLGTTGLCINVWHNTTQDREGSS